MCSEEPETFQKELDKMDDYFLTLINKKRSIPEDDSLISRIANSKINNEYRNLSKTKLRSQQEIYDLHLKELEK